jgi:hypothetical protein
LSTSARENILLYLVAQVAAVTGLTVFRAREAAVARGEGAVLIIKPAEEQVVKVAQEIAVRDMHVTFTLIVRGVVPDSAADPFLSQITSFIQSDTTLGGLAARCIEKSTRWDLEVADLTALVVELTFVIKYLTPTGTLGALA